MTGTHYPEIEVRDWRIDVARQMACLLESWQRDATRIGLPEAALLLGAARRDVLEYLTRRREEPPAADELVRGNGPDRSYPDAIRLRPLGEDPRRADPANCPGDNVVSLEAFRGA